MGDKPNLRFTPADSITINLASNETARSSVVVENQGAGPVAFKVKTTQPKRYLVKPNQGVILPGASEKIQIQVVPKERQQLVTDGTPSGSHDRFLVQSVVCDDSFTSLDKESSELTDKLAALWSSGDKSDVQQAKFSVSFTSPTDTASAGAASGLRETIQTSDKFTTSTSGADGSAAKSGGPMTPGGREFQSEVLNMRKKYDDLVSYTVNLTAERDKLKNELEQTKKDLNKAVVARLSAEKGEGGGDASRGGLRVKKAAEDGFSLIQLFLVAIICFLVGRYLHS